MNTIERVRNAGTVIIGDTADYQVSEREKKPPIIIRVLTLNAQLSSVILPSSWLIIDRP
jgi:hypothetical protein